MLKKQICIIIICTIDFDISLSVYISHGRKIDYNHVVDLAGCLMIFLHVNFRVNAVTQFQISTPHVLLLSYNLVFKIPTKKKRKKKKKKKEKSLISFIYVVCK